LRRGRPSRFFGCWFHSASKRNPPTIFKGVFSFKPEWRSGHGEINEKLA
jgi:hypothetical protein